MNKKQKRVLWIGIVVFALMGLFPPSLRRWESYGFILDLSGSQIGYGKLFVQWIVLAVVAGGLIYTLKDKKDERPKDEKSLQRKPINWKRGFRNITWLLAFAAAIFAGSGSAVYIVHLHEAAQESLQSKRFDYLNEYGIATFEEKYGLKFLPDELSETEVDAYKTELKQRAAELDQKIEDIPFRLSVLEELNATRELQELETGFWVSLSRAEFVALWTSTSVMASAIGFCGIWLIHFLIREFVYTLMWLAGGFTTTEQKTTKTDK